MLFPTLFSLFLLFETSLAACKYKFIHNASELVEFSNDVNGGTSYSGYTVYLVADIKFDYTLSQQFKPIGFSDNYFHGTFDGQGYVISALTISSSSFRYTGLFGVSTGITIKNVVIDNTCSFTSTY